MSTPTIYPDLEQGSDAWLQARCGVVTASVIGQLITSSKPGADMYACPKCDASIGDPCISVAAKEPKPLKVMHSERFTVAAESNAEPILSIAMTDTAQAAILRLAAERISGHVEDTFTTWDMQRGHDDEPKARDEYEQRHDVTVDEIGFMTREVDGVTIGYSPDGLVADDGLIECKSRRQATQLAHWINGDEPSVPAENMAQLQTGLLVSRRDWIDYLGFAEGWPTLEIRVYPEAQWAAVIVAAAKYAEAEIQRITTTYTERTAGLTPSERTPELADLRF